MRPTFLFASALSVLALTTQTADAQRPRSTAISVSRGSFAVQPYAGYLISQSLFEGPLSSSLGTNGTAVYGVQASLPLAPSASIVGTIGYGSGNLDVGLPILGGISIGDSNTWLFDLATELRLESGNSGRRFMPLAQLGGGAIRRELTISGVSARTTDFQVSGGIGADIPITQNLALRLMAKDYWGKADFGSLGPLEAKTKDIHTFALTGGVRIAF